MTRWTEEQLQEAQKRLSGHPADRVERPTVDSTNGQATQIPPKKAKAQKRSKYGAVQTDGYASKKEAKRAGELKLLEQAGKIRNLQEQVPFVVIPRLHEFGERPVKYVADFVYEERDSLGKWHKVVEDTKGLRTSLYIIKRKLMAYVHHIAVREV